MANLFNGLLIAHIAGGGIGLISGTIAASAKKGKRLHLLSGQCFLWAMLMASMSAMVLSHLPNHESPFLFAVGGFTFYMVMTGNRIVTLKRQLRLTDKVFGTTDYLMMVFGCCFTLYLLIQSGISLTNDANLFGLVPGVFGIISFNYVRKDYQLLKSITTVKSSWMYNHIIRMMGAMIAAYTAFLVVNVHIQQQWMLWLLPSMMGGILIGYFVKKYVPKKNSV